MMKLSVAAMALILVAGGSALAQVGTTGPNDRLLEELRRVTDDAERTRAASPAFVATLRDLSRRYAWPWSRTIISDAFADGDYTRNPVWTVEAGRFTAGFGELVSQHTPPAAPAQPAPGAQGNQGAAIFGALLQEFARTQGGAQAPAAGPVREARLRLDAQVPNAYALSIAMIPRSSAGGGFEFGVAQGTGAGYRLHYAPGAGNVPATLSLLRANPNGSAIVDSANAPANFENGQRHNIDFTRDAVGEMAIMVDGTEVMRVRDVGIRDGFNRFVFVNRGGDYRIHSVGIYGTP